MQVFFNGTSVKGYNNPSFVRLLFRPPSTVIILSRLRLVQVRILQKQKTSIVRFMASWALHRQSMASAFGNQEVASYIKLFLRTMLFLVHSWLAQTVIRLMEVSTPCIHATFEGLLISLVPSQLDSDNVHQIIYRWSRRVIYRCWWCRCCRCHGWYTMGVKMS